MSWISNFLSSKQQNPEKRLLFFSHQDLENEYYAVVRSTWYSPNGKICAVRETSVHTYDEDVIGEFRDIVCGALQAGADVSIACIEPAEEFGLSE